MVKRNKSVTREKSVKHSLPRNSAYSDKSPGRGFLNKMRIKKGTLVATDKWGVPTFGKVTRREGNAVFVQFGRFTEDQMALKDIRLPTKHDREQYRARMIAAGRNPDKKPESGETISFASEALLRRKRFTLKELKDRPTLHQGQWGNLKVDTGMVRVWLARTGLADGEPYDNKVTIEALVEGRWVIDREYPAEE